MILHKACVAFRHDFPVSAACCWEGSEVARYFSTWEGPGFSVVKLSRDPERQEGALPKDDHKKAFCRSEGRREDY